jgi:hypothetical protein
MRKTWLLILVITLTMGYVVSAQDDGIGLTVGAELGMIDVTNEKVPYIMPMLIYENAFLDGALDLYAELDYTFCFKKYGSDFPQWLYFDFALGYNLSLGSASTLSFLAENEFDTIQIAPGKEKTGIFTPGVRFTQGLDAGDIYFQLGVPIYYMDAEGMGLDFTFGWASTFGLGIELTQHNSMKPEFGYVGLDFIVSYETGPIYFEVEVDTYKEMDYGVIITPEFDYSFNNFTVYAKCEFAGVAGKGDMVISPAVGVKISF